MPIYEYRCEPCELSFETLIRAATDVAHCPKCGNMKLAKQFSVPAAAQTSHGSSALPVCQAPPSFGCGGGGGGSCGSGMCGMG